MPTGEGNSYLCEQDQWIKTTIRRAVQAAEGKWQKHIKPKLDGLFADFEKALTCVDNLQIIRMSITDAVNVFDENLDGILVNFNQTIYMRTEDFTKRV